MKKNTIEQIRKDDVIDYPTFYKVKGALIAQGLSLHGVAPPLGVSYSNAVKALKGEWKGPKGEEIKKQLCKMAGITCE